MLGAMGIVNVSLTALWLMLPAFLGNMMPVFVGGGAPIDLGRNWRDGRRILGDGKSWRGLILGPPLAVLLVWGLQWIALNTAWGLDYGFPSWGPDPWWAVLAYAMALGALVGDALESFFKRRLGKDRGEKWIPFDQLDFVVGSLVFGAIAGWLMPGNLFLDLFTWDRILAIVILTPAFHLLVNWMGYKLGFKQVPW